MVKFFHPLRGPSNYDAGIIEGFGTINPTAKNANPMVASLMPTVVGDDKILGEVFWKGIPDGSRVTSKDIVAQRDRFLNARIPGLAHLPLLPCIEDSVVKAIYEGDIIDGDMKDFGREGIMYTSESVTKSLERSHAQFCDEVAKAVWEELADGSEFKKAMTTASNLMHVIADQDVTYLYKRPYPFQAMIPTEANKGKAANFDIIGPFDLDASTGTEDQSFTESDPAPYNRTQYIKYLYSVYRVTMAAQLAGLAQVPARDMMAIRVDMAQDGLRSLRERLMLGVNPSPSDTTMSFQSAYGSSSTNYNGVYQIIQANTSTAGSGANWVTSAGATYDQINQDLDKSYTYMTKYGFQPNLAVCDYTTFGIYRRGLWEHMRTGPVQEMTSGITRISLAFPNAGGLQMIPHPFLPVASGYSCIMLLDTRLLARRTLWQDMNTQLAQLNLSQRGVISAAETLVDKSDATGAASLQGGVFGITHGLT